MFYENISYWCKCQVGQELLAKNLTDKYNVEVIGFDKKSLDITNFEHVLSILSSQKPNVVINSAAYTAFDKAEDNMELSYAINAKDPENLAKLAKHLIFHSYTYQQTTFLMVINLMVIYKATHLTLQAYMVKVIS